MGKTKQHQRKIIWNSISENISEVPVHHLTLVIVNERREIEIIKAGLRETLQPTDWECLVKVGSIPNSNGLRYEAFTIDSYRKDWPTQADIRQLYQGEVERDKRLGQHRRPDSLREYVERMFQ